MANSKEVLAAVLAYMDRHGFKQIQYVEYWYNDENETDRVLTWKGNDEIDLRYPAPEFDDFDFEGERDIGAVLSWLTEEFGAYEDTGVFEVDAEARTFSKTAEAIMPEPELITEELEEPLVFSLDDE